MFTRYRRSFAAFALLVMSWASVWCCCVGQAVAATPANGTTTQPSTRPTPPPCCDMTATTAVTCPLGVHTGPPGRSRVECPLVRVRETTPAAVAFAAPTPDFAAALPAWRVVVALPVSRPSRPTRTDRLAIATPPPTLLALHTSLLW